jgi:hypothetical protein
MLSLIFLRFISIKILIFTSFYLTAKRYLSEWTKLYTLPIGEYLACFLFLWLLIRLHWISLITSTYVLLCTHVNFSLCCTSKSQFVEYWEHISSTVLDIDELFSALVYAPIPNYNISASSSILGVTRLLNFVPNWRVIQMTFFCFNMYFLSY